MPLFPLTLLFPGSAGSTLLGVKFSSFSTFEVPVGPVRRIGDPRGPKSQDWVAASLGVCFCRVPGGGPADPVKPGFAGPQVPFSASPHRWLGGLGSGQGNPKKNPPYRPLFKCGYEVLTGGSLGGQVAGTHFFFFFGRPSSSLGPGFPARANRGLKSQNKKRARILGLAGKNPRQGSP